MFFAEGQIRVHLYGPPRVRLVVVSIGTTNPGAQWEDNEIRTSI